jgi:hypothetical protein
MRRLLIALLWIAVATAASAREQSDAPDIAILGFSPDGRYFAYEQYGYDIASDALDAAIFVIDRQTNKEAAGFPFGFIAAEQDGNYPAHVGGHDIDLDELQTEDGLPDLAKVRKLVREKAAPKLAALTIGTQGRRLAGVPATQRSPVGDETTRLKFVVWPTIPSAIPDQQLLYSIEARVKDTVEDCANAAPPARELPLTFSIVAERTWPDTKAVAKKNHIYPLAIEKDDCPQGLWISDVIAPPNARRENPVLVVVFLSAAWSSAVDSAKYHATFIEMPEEENQ